MNMMHSHDHGAHETGNGKSWLFSRTGLVAIGFLAIIAFLIYNGHGTHLLGYWPFLFILACPLMHVFMHGSHGGHGGHSGHQEEAAPPLSADNENQSAQTPSTPPQATKHDHAKGGCH
jgi:hypothetical protein